MQTGVVNRELRRAVRVLNANSPTIFTALTVAGIITTVAVAIKDTTKAVEILNNERVDRVKDENYQLEFEPVEVLELTWRCYIPTAIAAAFSIGCAIGSNSISMRRNAALVSMLSVAETFYKEYQEKVVDEIGEKKEALIRGKIAEDRITAVHKDDNQVIITGRGSMLCYDMISGREFYSDIESIRKSMNDFNEKLINEMVLSLNEWYDIIGLEPVDIGTSNGWKLEKGKLDLRFSAVLIGNKVPALCVEYRNLPVNIWG